ncbi:hypothetical protein HanPI659440_Chr11g0410291 [Helianthus annuus]|nr:hypothetical protein HanPI659440_Chr11g0410291 [Helianthus annuus]
MLVCYTGFVLLGDSYVMNLSFNPRLNMYSTREREVMLSHSIAVHDGLTCLFTCQ